MACNAIKRIFDNLRPGTMNKVVAWFVPSDTILKQTLEKLQDPEHPYRQTLDALFNHQVMVVDKEAALQGQGLKFEQLQSQLVILVLSVQSFVETVRVKKDSSTEQQKPKAFRENENFQEQSRQLAFPDKLIPGTDPTALIQVIAQQNPLIVIDESHNFKADLRTEMQSNLNPRFILELTATPRDNSNVVAFVDAMQLKRENMVKLPVIVENRNAPKDVLSAAIRMRNSLEKLAVQQEAAGGKYIRPIVLFQAQPKTDDDNITFDKIKKQLVDIGIPEKQIKIKTAQKDELKGLNLMSRYCEVRYIITVNALKEGWDCPFAYILATLANKTSRVDVEQILGRILRQPYTQRHPIDLLNLSYVFTSSNDFRETVENIIVSLQKAGFSKKDFREVATAELAPKTSAAAVQAQIPFEPTPEAEPSTVNEPEELNLEIEDPQQFMKSLEEESHADISTLQQQAQQISDEYNEIIKNQEESGDVDPLASITPPQMYYPIKEQYKDIAADMKLPMFFKKTSSSIFSDDEWVQLEKSMLSEGFDLSTKNADVDFTIVSPAGITVDVSDSGDAIRRKNEDLTAFIRRQYVDKSAQTKKDGLSGQIAGMIKLDDVSELAIREFVKRAIYRCDSDEIENLVDNIYLTKDAIQKKIEGHLDEHRRSTFKRWLDTGRISLKGHYTFIDKITLRDEIIGIDKGLYAAEESVNGFEYDVIAAISDNPNVLFWHRNRGRKEFVINGFINHYPDFILKMKSGATVLVETKGDHLDNPDTEDKIKLGQKWTDLAGERFFYFMVFQTKEVNGAINVKQLLQYLNEL